MIEPREMLWHPKKKEIEYWLDSKTLSFTKEESTGTLLSAENRVDEYTYSDIHEIFFAEFPVVLHEWFSTLGRKQANFIEEKQSTGVISWCAK